MLEESENRESSRNRIHYRGDARKPRFLERSWHYQSFKASGNERFMLAFDAITIWTRVTRHGVLEKNRQIQ